MTDVKRIVQMRDDKAALATLVQKGSLGDEASQRFTLAEQELEAEILDVVSEANTFREGWGQLIFPTASEMVTHMKHKEVYHDIPKERKRQSEYRRCRMTERALGSLLLTQRLLLPSHYPVALLGAQGKPVPKATITLPPLVTPPGTQITVQGPPGGPQPPQVAAGPQPGQQQIQIPAQLAQQLGLQPGQPIPPHIQQMLMARMAAAQQQQQGQQQQQAAKGQPLGPARPSAGNTQPSTPSKASPAVSGTSSPAKSKQNGGATKTATIEELASVPILPPGAAEGVAITPENAGDESVGSPDPDDYEDEGEDDSPSQSVSGDTTGGAGGAANRAQRRANNKKKNKKAAGKK